MTNDLHNFETKNEALTELIGKFLPQLLSFEAMCLPVSDDVICEIEPMMIDISGIIVKVEDRLDFSTDEQEIFNCKETLLAMQKLFSRLLRVVNDSVNVGIVRKAPQVEFDDYLKDKKKNVKRDKKVRENMRKWRSSSK